MLDSKEKEISNIKDTKSCSAKREKNNLSQLLKIQEVFELIREMNAKGVNIINTCISTYLIPYDRAKFKKPTEMKLLINPSKEKILSSEFSK